MTPFAAATADISRRRAMSTKVRFVNEYKLTFVQDGESLRKWHKNVSDRRLWVSDCNHDGKIKKAEKSPGNERKKVDARVESVKAAYDRIRNFLNLLCTVKSFESAINPESRTYYESFTVT